MLGLVALLASCLPRCGRSDSRCSVDADCSDGFECVRGVCQSAQFAAEDRKCHAAPACKAQGRCSAQETVSFFGVRNGYACVATEDADCVASDACAESGACTFVEGRCVPATAEHCTRSTRCSSHDECTLLVGSCQRVWGDCAPNPAFAGAPEWGLKGGYRAIELSSIPRPEDSARVEGGALLCTVSEERDFDTVDVKVAGQCQTSMYAGADLNSATFLVPGLSIEKGDSIGVSLSDHELIGAHAPAYVKARFEGKAAFGGELEGAKLSCLALSAADARRAASADIGRLDEQIASTAAERPRLEWPLNEPRGSRGARDACSDVAGWLGWDHTEVTTRLKRIEEIDRAWSRSLAEAYDKLRAKAKPAAASVSLADGVTVRPVGLVCGPALQARWDAVKPQLKVPLECGLELELENARNEPLEVEAFGAGKPFWELSWLHRSKDDVGSFDRGEVVDVRAASEGAAPSAALQVPPKSKAIVLVAGASMPLALGAGQNEEGTLLRLRLWREELHHLRTDLTR